MTSHTEDEPAPQSASSAHGSGLDWLGAEPVRGAARSHRFFHPRAMFSLLENKLLEPLFQGKPSDAPMRVWIPGCATGEQAYSVALLLAEYIDLNGLGHDLSIFATDTDKAALGLARRASYSLEVLADLGEDRHVRFFKRDGERCRIARRIRDAIVFSLHDLHTDPPLTGLDLIWCGGVTGARSPEQADVAVPALARALEPGGLLAFGAEERVAPPRGQFLDLQGAKRVYVRRAEPKGHIVSLARSLSGRTPSLSESHRIPEHLRPEAGARGQALLLQKYAPPSVIVDEAGEVLRFVGNTGAFLEPPAGPPTTNLVFLARLELRDALRRAFHRAVARRETVTTGDVPFDAQDPFRRVRITAAPIVSADGTPAEFVVTFEERGRHTDTLEMMRSELERAQEDLRRTGEEFQFTNEELRSSNEELLSTNEELRAANEELESVLEEVRTTKEDSACIVEDLTRRFRASEDAYRRARTRFANLGVPVVILDRDLRIQDFNEASTAWFNVIAADRGRPLADVTHGFLYEGLTNDAARVLQTESTLQMVVGARGGGRYLVRLAPYPGGDGVELTVHDDTLLTEFSAEAREAGWPELRERPSTVPPAPRDLDAGPPSSLGNFAAEIAHEIKDPLNAISLNAELALRSQEGEKIAGTLQNIYELAQRCGRLVRSVLGLARHETSNKWPNDVHVIVRHAAAIFQSYVATGLVELHWKLERTELLCDCNPTELEQVFVNLFKNSVEAASPESCTLTVCSRALDSDIIIVVSDDGPGMAPDVADRVFDRLYSTRRTSGGTGLGLPIVREIVEAHGGSVRVLPVDAGRGTNVEVILPRARPR